ncbi:NADPH-dependent F420 reductase [Aquimarina algiphila]|uniref:NADPH-dependent F420 reductase n=1 Tax=Aquimarina algiphila TaxID=2047982 RepID=UPI00232F2180|nr:NAD(P)-binding domain-containing protein [Aquimarina algiphila]
MKIGIIGSGNMGGQIGRLWGQAGHEVMFSSRNPKKLIPLTEGLEGGYVGTVTEAIEFGKIILLAINYWAIKEAIAQLKNSDKIIIDLTNPYKWSEKGGLERMIAEDISGAEMLHNELKESIIIKAFSSHQANSLTKHHSNPRTTVLYTCNDGYGKQVAETLIEDAGFAPVYYGELDKSMDIELFGKFSNKLMTIDEAKAEIKK